MVLLKAWIVVHFLTFCFFLVEECVSWAASLYSHGWAIHTVGKVVISQDDSLYLPFGRNRAYISNFLSSPVFTGSQESWSRLGFKTQMQIKDESQPSSWYPNWCPKHRARHWDPNQPLCWAQSCPPRHGEETKTGWMLYLNCHMVLGAFSTHLRPSLRTAAFGGETWYISGLWHLARMYGDFCSSFVCPWGFKLLTHMPQFFSMSQACSCLLFNNCFVQNTEDHLAANALSSLALLIVPDAFHGFSKPQ